MITFWQYVVRTRQHMETLAETYLNQRSQHLLHAFSQTGELMNYLKEMVENNP